MPVEGAGAIRLACA